MVEIEIPVKAHDRRGSKGVKAHSRTIKVETPEEKADKWQKEYYDNPAMVRQEVYNADKRELDKIAKELNVQPVKSEYALERKIIVKVSGHRYGHRFRDQPEPR